MQIKKFYSLLMVLMGVMLILGNCPNENVVLPIDLVYPKSSYSKMSNKIKSKEPILVKGTVKLEVKGIKQKQKEANNYWLEYYLNNDLIFSSKNNNDKTFYFNTQEYPDGEYSLYVNLWDSEYESAIGIAKIEIKNL